MQSAETVLGVLRERGRRGLPCNELYRQLLNPQLYLLAYGRLYSNKGAMTPGVNGETVDGMSLGKIEHVIDALRHERYRWSPARRVYIPKGRASMKLRPLGLPSWSDKLVGEVIRLLLEAYYEPTFSNSSHGFRPRRGCHTALRDVVNTWTGTAWFIEGDIAQCFDRLDHSVMLRILGEKIHDNRFLRLVRNMLTAGHMEDWVWNATHSGSHRVALCHRSCPTSICIRWMSTSRRFLSRNTPRSESGSRTVPFTGCGRQWQVPASAEISPRCGNCASNSTACPAWILRILATGG